MNEKCKQCGKTIVPFGNRRKNGKQGRIDWDGREYHLQCWTVIQKQIDIIRYLSNNGFDTTGFINNLMARGIDVNKYLC